MAKEKYSVPNVVYQEGRAEEIPESDYDAVFSNSVLHWCEDKEKVFKQVFNSLKKGGKFGFVTPSDFDIAKEFCTPEDMATPECRQHMIRSSQVPSSDDLHNLALKSGFKTIHSKQHKLFVIGSMKMSPN